MGTEPSYLTILKTSKAYTFFLFTQDKTMFIFSTDMPLTSDKRTRHTDVILQENGEQCFNLSGLKNVVKVSSRSRQRKEIWNLKWHFDDVSFLQVGAGLDKNKKQKYKTTKIKYFSLP